ncbi:hypothetical protein SYNGFB01_10690 [Synechococcus sp. GFB01]|nr:hypothetical protein SYNGFB01_10690 [Synechococcus sp. GFB01]
MLEDALVHQQLLTEGSIDAGAIGKQHDADAGVGAKQAHRVPVASAGQPGIEGTRFTGGDRVLLQNLGKFRPDQGQRIATAAARLPRHQLVRPVVEVADQAIAVHEDQPSPGSSMNSSLESQWQRGATAEVWARVIRSVCSCLVIAPGWNWGAVPRHEDLFPLVKSGVDPDGWLAAEPRRSDCDDNGIRRLHAWTTPPRSSRQERADDPAPAPTLSTDL